jgi:hypothetical protein
MALMGHKLTDFEQVITSDESWLFLYYPCDSVWVASRDDQLHRVKQKMTQKNA